MKYNFCRIQPFFFFFLVKHALLACHGLNLQALHYLIYFLRKYSDHNLASFMHRRMSKHGKCHTSTPNLNFRRFLNTGHLLRALLMYAAHQHHWCFGDVHEGSWVIYQPIYCACCIGVSSRRGVARSLQPNTFLQHHHINLLAHNSLWGTSWWHLMWAQQMWRHCCLTNELVCYHSYSNTTNKMKIKMHNKKCIIKNV